ncbi:exopolysaccharide transport family protein [Mucilaginibacter aquatilis]|uniref:AAA family ATPase n=1 Tax=Mucilaginibacter aquatilis TaxID=1517760 RepID=A0A6I4I9R6_9SPHI|nr:AAA family ATPase [Mucilaginibacter aquatilis]MVN90738.1 AAA family ATPase [Mucilaginibacter aquatilis]
MDLGSFLKVLLRHKYTLILVPLVTVIITFFLVRNQPDSYLSGTQIATGIVDQTQKTLSASSEFLQDAQVSQEFGNLTAVMRSKKTLDQVSYLLMIHDLTTNKPFRKPSKELQGMNASARKHAVEMFSSFYKNRQTLSLFNPDQRGLHDLLSSMKYDDQSLLQKLTIYRDGNSDFIVVQFESEDPNLSAKVVNDLCREFINYYSLQVKQNQLKAVNFYADLLKAKEDTLNTRLERLKDYKIRNRVLSLSEQAKALYAQLSDFETRRQQASKDAIAYKAAMNDIDQQFDPADRRYVESSMIRLNQRLIATRSQLESANNDYIQSGFKPEYKQQVDSLTNVLSTQISRSSDKYIANPMVSKQNLIEQKLTMQIQYDLAKSSNKSIENELARLNVRLTELVPHEAIVQANENAIQIAQDEYMDILGKYNQKQLESSFSVLLRQIETAMPGAAQPSKKMLLVIISGVVSFIFCVLVLFVLFYIDNTIKNPRELANVTKISVLGYLFKLSGASFDLGQIWNGNNVTDEHRKFRNLIQALRFEVDNEMNGSKILLINSMAQDEGKTFVALNLAYAYAQVNKKVLLIDGDFTRPDITKAVNSTYYLEDFLSRNINDYNFTPIGKITTMGNYGGDMSLLQVDTEGDIRHKLNHLKSVFDIIIIESPALNSLNKAKEWVVASDKVLTVIKAGQSLKEHRKLHISYLKSLNSQFIGGVLNEVDKSQLTAEERA